MPPPKQNPRLAIFPDWTKRWRKATVQDREAEQHAQKRRDAFDERFPGIVQVDEMLAFHVVEHGVDALARLGWLMGVIDGDLLLLLALLAHQ
ncbi:MAG: hypothetical protein WCD86_02440 [Ktedonobacteraceae bacterium]